MGFLNTWGFYRVSPPGFLLISTPAPRPTLGLTFQMQRTDGCTLEALVINQACKLSPEFGGVEGGRTQMVKDFWCRKTQGGFHKGPRTWVGSCKRKLKGREEREQTASGQRNTVSTQGEATRAVFTESAGKRGWSKRFIEGNSERETGKSFSQQNPHCWVHEAGPASLSFLPSAPGADGSATAKLFLFPLRILYHACSPSCSRSVLSLLSGTAVCW